jgi:hypothetical protein
VNATTCMNCNNSDLYDAELFDTALVAAHKTFFPKGVPVQCMVCLSCCFIAPYVAPGHLETVRAWKAHKPGK